MAGDIFNALHIAEGNLSVNFAAHLSSTSGANDYQRAEKMYLESLYLESLNTLFKSPKCEKFIPPATFEQFFDNLTPSSLEIMKNDH